VQPAQEHQREQRRSNCGYREARAPHPALIRLARKIPDQPDVESEQREHREKPGSRDQCGAGTDILRGIESGSKDQRRRSLRLLRARCFPSGSTHSQRAGRGGGVSNPGGFGVSRSSCDHTYP